MDYTAGIYFTCQAEGLTKGNPMIRYLSRGLVGAVVGGLVCAAAIAIAHAIVLKSEDWKDRAGYALLIGAIGGGVAGIVAATRER